MPDGSHGGHIVKHMALRFLHRSKIRCHLLRLHHHLTQQKDSRTHDLPDHPHHTDNGMYLLKIPAAGSQFLPYIRHRVNPDHINPQIGHKQKIVNHLMENHRVFVIQIPLIGIKGSHHPFPQIWEPGKVPGSCGGKYLRHGLLVFSRNIPVVEKEIPILIHLLTCPGPLCPLMIFGCMVHDKVQAKADPLLVTLSCKIFQIIYCTQFLLYLSEISYRIATVGTSFGGLHKRHQMKVIHPAGFHIIQVLLHSFQVPCKLSCVHHHTQHVIALKPFRILLPLQIQFLKGGFSLAVHVFHHAAQFLKMLL